MDKLKPRRITRKLTPAMITRLKKNRALIAAELPELIARSQMCKEAADEPTLSGELRRAIHASDKSLEQIASAARIPALALDEFLTGERTLRSDVLDRLSGSMDLALVSRK